MMSVRKNIEGAKFGNGVDATLQFKLVIEREKLLVVFDKTIVIVRDRIRWVEKNKISGLCVF